MNNEIHNDIETSIKKIIENEKKENLERLQERKSRIPITLRKQCLKKKKKNKISKNARRKNR